MTDQFDIGRHGRARFWVGTCPGAVFPSTESVQSEAEPADVALKSQQVALEIKLPKDPRVMYGLLGGRFETDPSATAVRIVVPYSSTPFGDGRAFVTPLASPPETPLIGLPKELADAVLEGVADARQRGARLGSGELRFDCAVYGPVGSSPSLFRQLSEAVTLLIARNRLSTSDVRQTLSEAVF